MLKVTNGDTRKMREICSKLTIKTTDLGRWQQNDLILILQFEMEKAHSEEPCQISKTELFATIVNGWRLLTISAKSFILDFWRDSEYASWCPSEAIKNLIKFECIQLNIKTLPQKKFKSFFFTRWDGEGFQIHLGFDVNFHIIIPKNVLGPYQASMMEHFYQKPLIILAKKFH